MLGGTNAIEPMVAAVDLNVPVLDADGMGRAFPQVWQSAIDWLLSTSTEITHLSVLQIRHYLPFIVDNPNYVPTCLVGNQDQTVLFENIETVEKVRKIANKKPIDLSFQNSWKMNYEMLLLDLVMLVWKFNSCFQRWCWGYLFAVYW